MDVAALALNIDSSKVVTASNDLDRFTSAATKAGAAGGKINLGGSSGSIAKLVAEVQSANSKLSALVGTMDKIASADRVAAAANDNVARSFANVDSHVVAYRQHLEGLARTQQDANAHVVAYRNQLATLPPALDLVPKSIDRVSTSLKFTAREGLNFSRQFADIGVTAAMGMNPLMIAIQQGPQLLDIFQEKAIATGTSVSTVFRAAAVSVLAAAAPFLPLIALLALAAAGIAALTAQANDDSGLKKYTTAMGYTKEEVKKLNAVTVTFGDTTKAVFQVALRSAADALGINTADMAKTWDRFLDRLMSGTRATLAGVYAAFAGMKAYLGEIEKGGITGLAKMAVGQGDPKLLDKTFGAAYKDGQRALDAVMKQARANAQSRQDTMAKGFYDKPSTPKGGKTDAEKLADILRDAQAQITAEENRAKAIGMTVQAATELEQRTELLNRITKAGIPVTAAVTAEVDRLAAAYAKAKVEADKMAVVQGVIDDAMKQTNAINDQLTLVGLYGDALERARIEMEMIAKARDALPKGTEMTGEDYKRIEESAATVARDQANLNRVKRMEEISKASKDAAYAMDLERGAIGLSGEALIAYNFAMAEKIKYQQAGITLSPEEVAAIEKAGQAYAGQRYAIDQTKQAMADAREVTKGFFSDWINGVREGGNVFKTFADSVLNALNRIIDKLLNKALDGFLDGMFSGSNGGGFLGSILGGKSQGGSAAGYWGGPDGTWSGQGSTGSSGPFGFANGGAFTNSIVNTPTLFRFAKGSALGEMGEAGPEAIMPLSRGPDGKLGVQARGGGRPVIRMGDYNPSFSFAGAVGIDGIASLVRQGGEETYNQVKRDLQTLLQQLDVDGTFAS